MLRLEDKITIAVGGPIKAGKDVLLENASAYQDTICTSLRGNFWVPSELKTISEEHNPELFERYSAHEEKYAFEFQSACLANRLAQQREVDSSSGLVFHGQPLEIDREIYAEANRENIGESFATYEKVYEEVRQRVSPPDVWIYLRVPEDKIEVLLDRIKTNGREGEKKFLQEPSYLIEIVRRNEQFFKEVVRQPVIEVDATHPIFGGESNPEYLKKVYQNIADKIYEYNRPPHLTLDEWEAVDHNRAQNGMREARSQLQKYLTEHQTIITIAGLVGSSKTGTAELLSAELGIDIMRELSGKHNTIADELLDKFLRDKKTYAYALQKSLIPKRIGMRMEQYASGKSFVEDRSPVEDQSIFWRRLHQQGYLSDAQMQELVGLAKADYAAAPQSDLMIKLLRSPRECRKMILKRGRPAEIKAWSEPELKAMKVFYDDLFEDMDKYGSHDGPTIKLPLQKLDARANSEGWNAKNTTHWGFLFQEILHSLLERD